MPDGQLRAYYWEAFTALAEAADLLDTAHPDYSFPSEDEVEYTAALHAILIFKDGSRLIVHSWLDATCFCQTKKYPFGNRKMTHLGCLA